MHKLFIPIGILILFAIFVLYSARLLKNSQLTGQQQPTQNTSVGQPSAAMAALASPILDWQARVTKKPFGIYVSPTDSPVSPERFTGYHTGVDFETFADEQNVDVPIMAICSGKLLLKEYASGYGGVAVQSCTLNGEAVTIIYGHLRLSSIIPAKGKLLTAGEKFAVLGTGYTSETDGERKHLHLGIHKGTSINILGYVQTQAALAQWLDVTRYLQKS